MEKEKGILADYDSLEVDQIIICMEKSFGIAFSEKDFLNIKTYGDFEKHILSKIKGTEVYDCTSQQVFYKLREIISENFEIQKEDFKLETKLDVIFPKKYRIENIKILEQKLSVKNKFLTFNSIQYTFLFIIFFGSLVFFFFNFFYAIIIFSVGMILSEIFKAKAFRFKNIREVSEFLKNEDYKKSRRSAESFNPVEVKDVIKNIFADKLDIEKSKLNYNTLL